jgi:hypothetical protein
MEDFSMRNIREALEAHGLTADTICEAVQDAEDTRAAGYNEDTIKALYESYLEEGTIIKGEFTLEKLMMAIDPDQAFADFWEETNA